MNQPALILPVALQMKTLCSLDDSPVTLLGCFAFRPQIKPCAFLNRLRCVFQQVTFTAMIWPVGLWTILLTEPYAPRPISPRSRRSSAVKSQCCSGEIFSFPDDSILCVRRRSLGAHGGRDAVEVGKMRRRRRRPQEVERS